MSTPPVGKPGSSATPTTGARIPRISRVRPEISCPVSSFSQKERDTTTTGAASS
jgi:hypothetical protein